jgi:transcriptional regulator with XRE-family HTH domain
MKFGARLRDAREQSGVTLREISARTRISVAHLEALERGEISRLPGGIFARAFVRAYAEQVGLDPERSVEEFLETFSEDGLAAGRAHVAIEDNQAIESDRRAAETVVKLLVVSVPLAIAVIYFSIGREPRPDAPARVVSEPREAGSVGEISPVKPAVTDIVQPDAVDVHLQPLVVVLRCTRDCWVTASADSEPILTRVVSSGEAPVLRAHDELVLTIGDAGAASLLINGELSGPLGRDSQVITTRLTPDNYRAFLNGR